MTSVMTSVIQMHLVKCGQEHLRGPPPLGSSLVPVDGMLGTGSYSTEDLPLPLLASFFPRHAHSSLHLCRVVPPPAHLSQLVLFRLRWNQRRGEELCVCTHTQDAIWDHSPAPSPSRWKNDFPWNWSLVPERLETTERMF